MNDKLQVYLISGCGGAGKTTLAKAFVKEHPKTALISGDDVHDFYRDKTITDFNIKFKLVWENILLLADNFLKNGINVVIEYVVENEMEQILSVVSKYDVEVRYVIMTADEDVIKERLTLRGDAYATERALYLRDKLPKHGNNKQYLYNAATVPIEIQVENLRNWELYAV